MTESISTVSYPETLPPLIDDHGEAAPVAGPDADAAPIKPVILANPLDKIRLAQDVDFDRVMDFARMMHKEDGIYDFDETKVGNVIRNTTNLRDGIIGLIGQPAEACVMLAIGSVWYSTEPHVSELLMFVHPDHRKENHTEALIVWAKHVADGLAMALAMDVLNIKRKRAGDAALRSIKARFCDRQLEHRGSLFTYRPQRSSADARSKSEAA